MNDLHLIMITIVSALLERDTWSKAKPGTRVAVFIAMLFIMNIVELLRTDSYDRVMMIIPFAYILPGWFNAVLYSLNPIGIPPWGGTAVLIILAGVLVLKQAHGVAGLIKDAGMTGTG